MVTLTIAPPGPMLLREAGSRRGRLQGTDGRMINRRTGSGKRARNPAGSRFKPGEPFVWRLKTEQPKVIELTIDSMVMNNDDAEQRQGVSPTYKKVKGFQPLHVIWDGRIVDAVFRGGKKNGNSGNTVVNTLRAITSIIRKEYS